MGLGRPVRVYKLQEIRSSFKGFIYTENKGRHHVFLIENPNAVKMAVLFREIETQRSLNPNLTVCFAAFDELALKVEI